MIRSAALVAFAASLSGCSDGSHYLVVTVTNRPAVHAAATLRVTLSNAGSTRTEELSVGAETFPLTFSVEAPGRAGELGVTVEAVDDAGLVIGRGATQTSVEADTASVRLDTTDFVVNTDFAGDQYPSQYFDTHGMQAAATPDGRWTVAYRDGCQVPCNMLARQFDATGQPLTTALAASTNGFAVSEDLTTSFSNIGVAAAGSTTLFAWNFRVPMSSPAVSGIACRSLDGQGRALAEQRDLSLDASTDIVSVAPLSNNNFAVTWQGLSPLVIRSVVVRPDCTKLGSELTVSTTAGADRPHVAANGSPATILYAWTVDGSVYLRRANATNTLQGATDTRFLPASATEIVEFVRVAPLGTGFAVIVRWALSTGVTGPGRIEMYRTNAQGAVLGQPVTVTTRSGSDFASSESFGVASNASNDTVLVTWHSCETNGDGQGCGVFARAFRSDGTPVGEEITVPTTTLGDQKGPSAAALPEGFAVIWRDASGQAPDVSDSAVRARIIYLDDGTSQ